MLNYRSFSTSNEESAFQQSLLTITKIEVLPETIAKQTFAAFLDKLNP
jgi:hypothetical protein